MRFMMLMIPKGYEKAEPGAMPDAKAVAAMMKYNESLQKAGVLLALDGLHPPSMVQEFSDFPADVQKVRAVTIIDGPVVTVFDGVASKRPPSAAMMTRQSTTTRRACHRPDFAVRGRVGRSDACGGQGN